MKLQTSQQKLNLLDLCDYHRPCSIARIRYSVTLCPQHFQIDFWPQIDSAKSSIDNWKLTSKRIFIQKNQSTKLLRRSFQMHVRRDNRGGSIPEQGTEDHNHKKKQAGIMYARHNCRFKGSFEVLKGKVTSVQGT